MPGESCEILPRSKRVSLQSFSNLSMEDYVHKYRVPTYLDSLYHYHDSHHVYCRRFIASIVVLYASENTYLRYRHFCDAIGLEGKILIYVSYVFFCKQGLLPVFVHQGTHCYVFTSCTSTTSNFLHCSYLDLCLTHNAAHHICFLPFHQLRRSSYRFRTSTLRTTFEGSQIFLVCPTEASQPPISPATYLRPTIDDVGCTSERTTGYAGAGQRPQRHILESLLASARSSRSSICCSGTSQNALRKFPKTSSRYASGDLR